MVRMWCPEDVLVFRHINALAAEAHAFHFEAKALFAVSLVLEPDHSTRADHTLPWQRPVGLAQNLHHLAMI